MAMENGTLSASDVALLSGNNGMWGDGSFMWIFALLILAGGGFNGFGWGNGFGYQPQYATQDFVQNGFNFNDLQDQNRDIMNSITNGTAQSVAATNQAKYDNINVAKDIQSALTAQIGDVKMLQQQAFANQTECCCNTLRAIDGVNYNMALNTASINQNTTAQVQKVLDALAESKIDTLQQKVNELQLREAMNGVVRYPNQFAYNAGSNPFCGCGGCGC